MRSTLRDEDLEASIRGLVVGVRAKVETFPGRLTYMFRSSILHVAQFLYLGDSNCEVTRLPAEPRPKSCASFLESTRRNLSPLRKNFTFETRTKLHQTHFQVDSSNMCRFDETCIIYVIT